MKSDPHRRHAPSPDAAANRSVVAVGEVLWDLFDDGQRLGGAPLNFSSHVRRLGHPVSLISALGADALGAEAAQQIAALNLDCRFLQTSTRFATGTAKVKLGEDGSPAFAIARPAAYDDLDLTPAILEQLAQCEPAWVYFGSLFAATDQGRRTLNRLLKAAKGSLRFLDLNLRPGSDSPDLVTELRELADVVKLNEPELERVAALTGLPRSMERFCHAAIERYGWQALAITLGSRGCVIGFDGDCIEAQGQAVTVVDTVGAGDAFAAAFLHGLSQQWPADRIAEFANRVAAEVTSHAGALPESGSASMLP
jgi:fructokinase